MSILFAGATFTVLLGTVFLVLFGKDLMNGDSTSARTWFICFALVLMVGSGICYATYHRMDKALRHIDALIGEGRFQEVYDKYRPKLSDSD